MTDCGNTSLTVCLHVMLSWLTDSSAAHARSGCSKYRLDVGFPGHGARMFAGYCLHTNRMIYVHTQLWKVYVFGWIGRFGNQRMGGYCTVYSVQCNEATFEQHLNNISRFPRAFFSIQDGTAMNICHPDCQLGAIMYTHRILISNDALALHQAALEPASASTSEPYFMRQVHSQSQCTPAFSETC